MGRHRKAPESLPTTVADVIAAEDALVDVEGYREMMSDKFQLILSLACFFWLYSFAFRCISYVILSLLHHDQALNYLEININHLASK